MSEREPMNLPVIENTVSDRLRAGIDVFFDVSVKDPERLNEFILAEAAAIKESFSRRLPPGYSYSRKLYRSFSVDPTKYRPSSEALWRRIKRGLEFPFVNPFVDITNLLSLKFQVSYGLYDLDKINGAIKIARGGEGDAYQGIRKDMVSLKGKILLKDESGPFGNPSSDSLRTCTSEGTSNILQVIFFHPDDPAKDNILSRTHRYCLDFFDMSGSRSYMLM
jgi:DNA/RNA-binding domain of Phe-tRNA-synthetase-like protein